MKTREEIQLEYENQRVAISNQYYAQIEAARAARDAALAELDDPLARLIAAAKAHVEGILREHVYCYPGAPCPVVREIANLRDAIDYAEQRRAQE